MMLAHSWVSRATWGWVFGVVGASLLVSVRRRLPESRVVFEPFLLLLVGRLNIGGLLRDFMMVPSPRDARSLVKSGYL